MGDITFHINPYIGTIQSREKNQLQTLIYPVHIQSNQSFIQRINSCFDPIFNKEYGCFSKYNSKKVSCFTNLLPSVLSCMYFGNSEINYCIPHNVESDILCKGKCGFSQFEVKRLYGCINSYGKPSEDCNTYPSNFCNCDISKKKWNEQLTMCTCPDDKNDYGKCCSEKTCNLENNEQFNCDTDNCECLSSYTRLPSIPSNHPLFSYSNKCVKLCATGNAQNNPINAESNSGCGTAIGKNGDLCCNTTNMCVLDNGEWDNRFGYNPKTKSQCLSSYGVWRITDNTKCPRLGHCEYPSCNSPQLILDIYESEGPAWIFKCESCESPPFNTELSPPQCKNVCTSFCSTQNTFPSYNKYNKSYCTLSGEQQYCNCHCKK